MHLSRIALVRSMSGVALVLTAACSAQVSIRGLGFLNATNPTTVTGISPDGRTVLGASGLLGSRVPLYWTTEPAVQLHQIPVTPGWVDVIPVSSSTDGSIIFGFRTTPSAVTGFRFTSGATQPLVNPANVTSSAPQQISRDGSFVAGSASFTTGGQLPVRWNDVTPGTQLPLPALTNHAAAFVIADDNSIYGSSYNSLTNYAALVRWTGGTPTILANLPHSATVGAGPKLVSADGATIAGFTDTYSPSLQESTWLWNASTGFQTIPPLSGTNSFFASSMTADASVLLGWNQSPTPASSAVVWTPQRGTLTLTDYFTALGVDLQGWTLDRPAVVSADGTRFAGEGVDPVGRREAYLITIPCPASVSWLLCGMAVSSRRRRAPSISWRM